MLQGKKRGLGFIVYCLFKVGIHSRGLAFKVVLELR